MRKKKGFNPLEIKKLLVGKKFLTGFTLSELLLAAAILAFVLTGILALFISCIFLNEANRNLTIATTHAEHVMEEIKNTDFDNIAAKINNADWDWDVSVVGQKGLTALTAESIDTSVSGSDLLDITVTINWQDRGQRSRSTYLETLIAEP